ncbi:glycosylphosphatidylinositol anchor attachment 1 protein [Anabrus simplex]|uniref:glycosylphosphatidylinositol anchor attachment 1 protein n=1 Tax=Anabrus simplex TaxID=316456 RepID=UPI0034DD8F37
MGLLTDPGAGRGKLTHLLVKYHGKLCLLLYLAGLVWFGLLAHEHFNAGTYFSENALLPGLVKGEFDEDGMAKKYLAELVEEANRFPDGIPYSWLLAKFGQLSLDTYTHNFTLNSPLGQGKKYVGKNVYAILRAPRSSSTEALVLSVPYRPLSSIQPTTFPSIALMLSLGKFFRRQKYWAKDIIFLVTEHEQLGIQAWLEAYHRATCGRKGVLEHGDMMGRGGAIQAAINLELHSDRLAHLDVKVEGLNGQLPNLDLVNLVHRMCSKEAIKHTFKNRENPNYRDPYQEWLHSFKTLMSMVATQATGIPNGNHGLFHRFGIEAVTLEGFEKKGRGGPIMFYQMGRVLEGLFRSLNNLLERFHQSYFFYLLPATDRYISIGMYMPPLGLLCGGLLIKGLALWLKMQEDPVNQTVTKGEKKSKGENKQKSNNKESLSPGDFKAAKKGVAEQESRLNLVLVGSTLLTVHALGVILLAAPQYFSQWGTLLMGLNTDASIYWSYFFSSVILLGAPFITARNISCSAEACSLLNIVALLELATLLLAVSMHNFSLAMLCATLYVPAALWIGPSWKGPIRFLQKIWWLLLHPLSLLTVVVIGFTAVTFPEDSPKKMLSRGLEASYQALMYSVVDSYIYGNWVYSVAVAILLPAWMLFWIVLHSTVDSQKHT